jgi:hypothetical protein
MTVKRAARVYQAAAAPATAALKTLGARFRVAATRGEFASDAAPAQAALATFNRRLSRLAAGFPTAAPDIKALVTVNARLARDLGEGGSIGAPEIAHWEQQLQIDLAKLSGAIAVVRADLGLRRNS